MDIENLKQTWNRMNTELSTHEKADDGMLRGLKSAARSNRLTDRLTRRFAMLAMASLAFVIMSQFTSALFGDPLLNHCISVYFLISTVMSAILYLYARKIDLCTLPVADALRRVVRLRILRGRFKIFLIAVCALLVIYMFYDLWKSEPETLPYAILGAAIGLVSGLKIDKMTGKEIQELKSLLQQELES